MSDQEKCVNWDRYEQIAETAQANNELDILLGVTIATMCDSEQHSQRSVGESLARHLASLEWREIALDLWNNGLRWREVFESVQAYSAFRYALDSTGISNSKALQTAVIRYAEENETPIRKGKRGRPSKRK